LIFVRHSREAAELCRRAIIRVAVFLGAGVGSLVGHSGEAAELVGL